MRGAVRAPCHRSMWTQLVKERDSGRKEKSAGEGEPALTAAPKLGHHANLVLLLYLPHIVRLIFD